MMDFNLYAALVIGMVGSLHCIGMCGPIAISLPLGSNSWWNKMLGSLTYNIGRLLTYGVLGLLFGFMGKGLELAGLQRWASILIGSVMVLSVVFPALFKGKLQLEQFLFGFAAKMVGKFRKLFAIHSFPSLLLIGLLNGLLPCGLVYVALAGALNTNDVIGGVVFMLVFGLGTIPVMLTIPLLGNIIGNSFRRRYRHLLSSLVVLLGILFILRGLSLGIPYVSPPKKMLKPHEKMMKHTRMSEKGQQKTICKAYTIS